MEEVTSSSFRVCWDEPEYHGSPYLAGYNISYNNKWERVGVVDCFNFDCDNLEWGRNHNIAVSAVSESGNETAENTSSSLTLLMGMFPILMIAYILGDFFFALLP